MNLNRLSRHLYRASKVSRDIRAVQTGRIGDRIVRRVVWRAASKAARNITRALLGR